MEGLHAKEGSIGRNHLRASSRGCKRLERKRIREQQCIREQQHMQDGHETRLDSDEGSSQREQTVSYIFERSRRSNWLRKLENLRKQVNDLEIELRGTLGLFTHFGLSMA